MHDDPDSAEEPPKTPARRSLLKYLLGFSLLGIVGVWFASTVETAREAARQSACQGRLNQMLLAFHNYHDHFGSFPPAYFADAEGKPMHSWRVLILPFLEEGDVYEQYDFNEPWNGPNNSKLADQINLHLFHCPSKPDPPGSALTDYVLVVGAETAFPGSKSTTFDDFRDGLENSILLVEIANSDIHWMEPRDLNFQAMSFRVDDASQPSISSPHPAGPAVVFGDRITTYRLDASLRPETLKALMTVSGGENVVKDELILENRSPRTLGE
ncbi:MAG TPA: DUF1559 domain-containing protein [Planctomycetaceae bacterium]|nr:DUF1559 domain-containing protein [Planctomycetaceae bacterium]